MTCNEGMLYTFNSMDIILNIKPKSLIDFKHKFQSNAIAPYLKIWNPNRSIIPIGWI